MSTFIQEVPELLVGIPPGTWVAISEVEHRVVASGIEPTQVMDDAKHQGVAKPLIVRVPDESTVLFL